MINGETSGQYLYKIIRKFMIDHEVLDQTLISRGSGVSPFTLSSFLEARGEVDLQFEEALSLTKYFNSIHFIFIMETYCLKLDHDKGILNSLEFASNYERHLLTDKLLVIHKDKSGPIKDWLEIYELNRQRKKQTKKDTVLRRCDELGRRVSCATMKIKLKMIEVATMGGGDYQSLLNKAKDINDSLQTIEDNFIKESFKVKVYGYFANAMLYYEDDREKAIKYAKYLIKNKGTPMYLIASAHLTIGQAFLFEEKEASLRNIKIAIQMFELSGYEFYASKLRHNDLVFVQNIHGEKLDLLTLRGEELAHQLIVRKQFKQAIAVLKSVEETDFSHVYKGIASKDINLLEETLADLTKAGKHFLKNYVERELQKLYQEREVNT